MPPIRPTSFRWALQRLAVFAALLACAEACRSGQPSTAGPSSAVLTGRWHGALTARAPCVGDWSSFALTVTADRTGEVVTNDGQHFSASEVVGNGVMRVDVMLPSGLGECQTLSFVVMSIEYDAAGQPVALSGQAIGRCCGTIDTSFRLTKS